MSIVAAFPAEWRCDVTVHRSGGRNADGDPVPATDHPVVDCLVGPRSTNEPVDRTELTDTTAVLYHDDPAVDITGTDTLTVPAGHFMAGTYAVEGDPSRWPLGTEVPLRRL